MDFGKMQAVKPASDQEILERGAHDAGAFYDQLIRIICNMRLELDRLQTSLLELSACQVDRDELAEDVASNVRFELESDIRDVVEDEVRDQLPDAIRYEYGELMDEIMKEGEIRKMVRAEIRGEITEVFAGVSRYVLGTKEKD